MTTTDDELENFNHIVDGRILVLATKAELQRWRASTVVAELRKVRGIVERERPIFLTHTDIKDDPEGDKIVATRNQLRKEILTEIDQAIKHWSEHE